jgi:hypothetical protein
MRYAMMRDETIQLGDLLNKSEYSLRRVNKCIILSMVDSLDNHILRNMHCNSLMDYSFFLKFHSTSDIN